MFSKNSEQGEGKSVGLIGSVALPKDAKGILLLGILNNGELSFTAMADNFMAATATDWIFLNTSDLEVAMQVGAETKPIRIGGGDSFIGRIKAPANKGAAISAAIATGDGWKQFFSTYWPIYPNKRCLVIFFPYKDRVRIHRITDKLARP